MSDSHIIRWVGAEWVFLGSFFLCTVSACDFGSGSLSSSFSFSSHPAARRWGVLENTGREDSLTALFVFVV